MNESVGWIIYALACAIFGGMAVARKEQQLPKINPKDVYEMDDVWHDLGGGSMLESPGSEAAR